MVGKESVEIEESLFSINITDIDINITGNGFLFLFRWFEIKLHNLKKKQLVCGLPECMIFQIHLKLIVHPKMKILSSLAHPALVSFFCLNAEVDILENIGNQAVDGSY